MRSSIPFRLLVLAGVLLLCCGTLSAQGDYASLIRENPDRAAGVHHSYEYLPGVTTPVPRGYKPFYVSHYGRHGSRRSTSSSAQKAFDYMDSARVAGILTPLGEELWAAVNAIHDDHIDMVGELTPRGGREHRARYPSSPAMCPAACSAWRISLPAWTTAPRGWFSTS